MRLVTYLADGVKTVGVMKSEGNTIVPISALGFESKCMNCFIRELQQKSLTEDMLDGKAGVNVENVKLLAPIEKPERDVICLGLNYRDHVEETADKDKGYDQQKGEAVYFSKRVDIAVAPDDAINAHEDICTKLDYEVELAVIIGKDADHVKAEDAYDYIVGYTILNDVSARNLQTKHQQWYLGKSLDGFTPIGPWIVTTDEIPGKPDLEINCYVNGELRQHSRTSNMIFDIGYVIEELSAGMVLQAGTIISTGTPSGVALGMENPIYLKKGDIVKCEIEKIGVLENPVG